MMTDNHALLALDPGNRTGWAVMSLDGSIIDSGVWDLCARIRARNPETGRMRFYDPSLGQRFRRLYDNISAVETPIGLVVAENPYGRYAVRTLHRLCGIIDLAAYDLTGSDPHWVHVSTIRTDLRGPHKGADAKIWARQRAHEAGADTDVTDDEADAIMVALWAVANLEE